MALRFSDVGFIYDGSGSGEVEEGGGEEERLELHGDDEVEREAIVDTYVVV